MADGWWQETRRSNCQRVAGVGCKRLPRAINRLITAAGRKEDRAGYGEHGRQQR